MIGDNRYFSTDYNHLVMKISDDRVILDKTIGDQVSIWKRSRGFTDELVTGHVCSGHTCSYTQIGDVFLCEKTGRVHGRNSAFTMIIIGIRLPYVTLVPVFLQCVMILAGNLFWINPVDYWFARYLVNVLIGGLLLKRNQIL